MPSLNQENLAHARFAVDDLVIDTGTQLVHRGEETIELPELSFGLLLALVEAAPNVLSHDELMDRVWSGRVVSQETVTQRIKLLRQALGDDAHEPRYIGLVRGRGYRMLPPVEVLEPAVPTLATPSPGGRRRNPVVLLLLIGLLAGLGIWLFDRLRDEAPPTPGPPDSVAVLPFVNASGDSGDLYISEGLGDELRNQLGLQLGLRVAARSSSNAFRGETFPATEIARRLGVAVLVEGTLRREANELRISVQLIDGATGFQTWSRTYNVQMQDLLDVQSQIAQEVTQQLLPLADSVEPQPVTRSVSANELLLLARHYEQLVRDETIVDQSLLLKAIALYREATRADPSSALAHSHLGGALLYLGDVAAAEAPIFEALRLDPDLADVQYTLGLYHWMRRQPGVGAAYERAISLNPNHVEALSAYAKWWAHQFEPDRGEIYLWRALRLDPMTHHRYLELGNYLGIAGRIDTALSLIPEIEQRFDDAQGHAIIARIYELAGQLDVAVGWILRAKRLDPDNPELDWSLAELLARLGEAEEAARFEPEPGIGQLYWTRQWPELIVLAEELAIEYPNEPEIRYALGWAYAAAGLPQAAVQVLERSGLPEIALVEARRSPAVEAGMTLVTAYEDLGNRERARELAEWYEERMTMFSAHGESDPWWSNIYLACAQAILRKDHQALNELERTVSTRGLVWYPLVSDALCFRRFRGEPRYEATVAALDQRIVELRMRLPGTLSAMGVDLSAARPSEGADQSYRQRILDDVDLLRMDHGNGRER